MQTFRGTGDTHRRHHTNTGRLGQFGRCCAHQKCIAEKCENTRIWDSRVQNTIHCYNPTWCTTTTQLHSRSHWNHIWSWRQQPDHIWWNSQLFPLPISNQPGDWWWWWWNCGGFVWRVRMKNGMVVDGGDNMWKNIKKMKKNKKEKNKLIFLWYNIFTAVSVYRLKWGKIARETVEMCVRFAITRIAVCISMMLETWRRCLRTPNAWRVCHMTACICDK